MLTMTVYTVAVIRGVISSQDKIIFTLCREFIYHGVKENFGLGAYCGDPVCHDFNLGKRLRPQIIHVTAVVSYTR